MWPYNRGDLHNLWWPYGIFPKLSRSLTKCSEIYPNIFSSSQNKLNHIFKIFRPLHYPPLKISLVPETKIKHTSQKDHSREVAMLKSQNLAPRRGSPRLCNREALSKNNGKDMASGACKTLRSTSKDNSYSNHISSTHHTHTKHTSNSHIITHTKHNSNTTPPHIIHNQCTHINQETLQAFSRKRNTTFIHVTRPYLWKAELDDHPPLLSAIVLVGGVKQLRVPLSL